MAEGVPAAGAGAGAGWLAFGPSLSLSLSLSLCSLLASLCLPVRCHRFVRTSDSADSIRLTTSHVGQTLAFFVVFTLGPIPLLAVQAGAQSLASS